MQRAEGVAGAVLAEQVATVFRQMPLALAVNLINAAVIAAVLWPSAGWVLLAFFGSIALVTLGRGALWFAYRRAGAVATEATARWMRFAAVGSLLAGLCWGLGGSLLFAAVPEFDKVLLTIAVAGMCVGAVVVDSACLPVLLAFVLPACLPMAARFLASGSATNVALGTMTVVFAAALGLAGRFLSRTLAEAMRLRFELGAANQRLQSEIAERRATQEALHQAQKLEAIGQLTGGIAHDFNNLMTVIIGNLTLARMRASRRAAVQPRLQAALRAAEQGAALIQRLLAFARKQQLDPQPLHVPGLLAGIREMLQRTLGPEVRLVISTEPDLAPALVDPNQVELAILNLAINARDAMPDGGTVHIAAANRACDVAAPRELAPGDYVVLSITDDGAGMDEATLARAFEPFFTTKPTGRGSGLGLPMVQGFAAQSGGAAHIRSRLGEGTTVELWLPRAADRPAEAEAPTPTPEFRRGAASVLLCDDDDAVRSFLSDFLQSIGYTVHEANGGEAAIRILEDGLDADLLVVDYAMPGMNGIETIRQARLRRPDMRPLLITGYSGDLGGGAAGIPLLRKPFAPSELAQRVAELAAA